jgi:hypothetical protein
MKKTLLFLLFAGLVLNLNAVQIKVGYFGMTKTMPTSDPLLLLLQSDANFVVTENYTAAKTDNPTYDLSVYDVIIVQESTAGDATILMPGNSLALANINKPVLYNKSYAFKSGRALASGSSTGAEIKGVYTITVNEVAKTNDLFKACTYETGNDIKLFESGANDLGADADTKALNYTTGTVLTPANVSLATVTGITNAVICFNDIPSGTDIDGQTTAARMITVGMNFGAMCKSTSNLTDNGLTILRNAVYMLAGLPVPSTKATLSTGVSTVKDFSKVISVDYYTINGVLVKEPTKGIYIKKSSFENGTSKFDKVIINESVAR